ncbi:MAG: hypothetical protein ACM3VT_05115 [Solirubrobacterales bacterium]
MHTYRIQGADKIGRDNLESILGVVVLVVLLACGLASMPMTIRTAGEDISVSLRRDRERTQELQELRNRDGSLEAELKKLSKTLESTKADLASFRQVHDTLIAQVAVATAKMQEIAGQIEDTKGTATKLTEYATLQEQLKKERDAAVNQAKDATERVRELTLRLQRAGAYP